MKHLLAITLVFILSLFVVEASDAEVKKTVLKCEMIYFEVENQERKIEDLVPNLRGEFYIRYYVNLVHQGADRLLEMGMVGYVEADGSEFAEKTEFTKDVILKESTSTRYYQLNDDDGYFLLDRETLIFEYGITGNAEFTEQSKTLLQCDPLDTDLSFDDLLKKELADLEKSLKEKQQKRNKI